MARIPGNAAMDKSRTDDRESDLRHSTALYPNLICAITGRKTMSATLLWMFFAKFSTKTSS